MDQPVPAAAVSLFDGYAAAWRDEAEIVWVAGGPDDYPYVREVAYDLYTRTRTPRRDICGGRLVAYATLRPTATPSYPGMFLRRLWWLAPHDPYPAGPVEAVDPRSLAPGQPSRDWAEAGRPGREGRRYLLLRCRALLRRLLGSVPATLLPPS